MIPIDSDECYNKMLAVSMVDDLFPVGAMKVSVRDLLYGEEGLIGEKQCVVTEKG